jgi:hypothetical protein
MMTRAFSKLCPRTTGIRTVIYTSRGEKHFSRVATLIRFKPSYSQISLALQTLQEDLRHELFLYQLSKLLYVLTDDEDVPMLQNSKQSIQTAISIQKYFSPPNFPLDNPPEKVQVWDGEL